MIRKNSELSSTTETKRYARSGAALPKKFYDEIYPLALFVNREFSKIPDAVVIPNLSNDNCDATVCFNGRNSKTFIEITQAKDGYDESLRMEVLSRDGAVSLTSPITKVSGRRGTSKRVVEIPLQHIAKDRRETVDKNLSLVETAVRAKANRQYGKQFTLLVVVDDYWPFYDPGDLSEDLDFERLVVFGLSGDLLFSYRLPKYFANQN